MSVKLISAAVVLLVGFALASLFPTSPRDLEHPSAALGLALRRDAPRSPAATVDLGTRTNPLPALEAVAAAQSPPHSSQTPVLPSSTAQSQFHSPPSMRSNYATLSEVAARQISNEERGRDGSPVRRPTANRPPRETVHRVVDGDTLPDLADRYLGDAGLADRIREANRDRLPDNPNWLPIGVELQIPAAATAAQPKMEHSVRQGNAETRLVPIEPAPVMADTNAP